MRRLLGPKRLDAGMEAWLAEASAVAGRELVVPGTTELLTPFAEQIAGARALLRGAVAEMATGEGKTLVAGLAAAVRARSGPVHIATANDYLAARDAAWLAPLYTALGLTVGVITAETDHHERGRQYGRDVVYATLAEFGFDYLRDRLVTHPNDRVQTRGLHALIADEADLLLIDEARTPLVIARTVPEEDGPDMVRLARVVDELVACQAERVAEKLAVLATLPERTWDAAVVQAQLRRGAPRDPAVLAHFTAHRRAARRAEQAERELRGGHAWMLDDGLLFVVEERAGTAYLTEEGQALVEDRVGQLFERPAEHDVTIAALHALILARALYRRDHDYLIRDGAVVLVEEATGRAAESRRYMEGLHAAIETVELGVPRAEQETLAGISVQAFVRLYTHRAGMTGTASGAANEFSRVYDMTVERIPRRRRNRRIDLLPRLYRTAAEVDRAVVEEIGPAHATGQPVLVGTADIARSDRLSALLTARGLPHTVLNAREHQREAEVVTGAGQAGAITIATAMAGRGTDIRLSEEAERAGGLRVIATEPGSDRRLDDQLRGRSGRQGEAGVTRLYASLEDETLRFYGAPGRRAAAIRALAGGTFVEGKAAARVINDAQSRATRLHADARTMLYEMDRVVEGQRKAMLAAYDRVLAGAAGPDALRSLIPEVVAVEWERRTPPGEVDEWRRALIDTYGLPDDGPSSWSANEDALAIALRERWERVAAETGEAWPALVRVALLDAASSLWARHVETIDHLQRSAPTLFAFLPVPVALSYAQEATRLYTRYNRAVLREALATVLTLPQQYERALPPTATTPLSQAALDALVGDLSPVILTPPGEARVSIY